MGALSGKVAVVTGASRGIGKGIALALAEQGATVYVSGRTNTPGTHPLPGTIDQFRATAERVLLKNDPDLDSAPRRIFQRL